MRVSATMLLTDQTVGPEQLAPELEARGFTGLYLAEHTHLPVAASGGYPGAEYLPAEYARLLDPLVALAAASAVTDTLTLGTAISLVAQHDPIVLAKQIATLDRISSGRFTLGVGFGWIEPEAADHKVPWVRRRSVVRDHMAVMQALWAEKPTAFEGGMASVPESVAFPKPAGNRVRTLLGGAGGPRLLSHLVAYGDGWMPIDMDPALLARLLPGVRARWEDGGRRAEDLQVVPAMVRPSPAKMDHYRDLGVNEVVLQLPYADWSSVLRTLDGYARYL